MDATTLIEQAPRLECFQTREQGEKLQARTGSDSKVQNLRIPSALAALEVVGLLPTFGRAANRQDDPRAGSQAAGAVASATGTLMGWRADFYEKNVLEEIKAKIPAHKWSAELGKATSAELQAMKIGAAHWVAAGAVVGVIWDTVDMIAAKKAERRVLMLAYFARAVSGGTALAAGLVAAYSLDKARIVLWCTRVNIATGILIAATSYAIDKLKEKEWTEWLHAEPFRRGESKVSPHRSEALMLSALANAVADMKD